MIMWELLLCQEACCLAQWLTYPHDTQGNNRESSEWQPPLAGWINYWIFFSAERLWQNVNPNHFLNIIWWCTPLARVSRTHTHTEIWSENIIGMNSNVKGCCLSCLKDLDTEPHPQSFLSLLPHAPTACWLSHCVEASGYILLARSVGSYL